MIYKGYTQNLERRLRDHEAGKVQSTKKYIPCRLLGYEVYTVQSDALRREKFLKTTEGIRYLKQQYRDSIAQSD